MLIENLLAEIEKGQQMAGHFPDAEAMDRARRVLDGTTSVDAARAEVLAKHRDANPRPGPRPDRPQPS